MHLEKITDQKTMRELFAAHLEWFPEAQELVELKIFRHDPKLVIDPNVVLGKYELTVRLTSGQTKLYVVRGSTDLRNKRLKSYHILKALWETGFNVGPNVVPRPLAYIAPHHLLLYENYPGSSLMQKIESGQDEFLKKIETALDWLAAFHQKKPKTIPEAEYDWNEEKKESEQLIKRLTEKYSNQADRTRLLAQQILKTEQKLLNPDNFSLVHGDFQPNNILLGENQIAVIDFNDAFLYEELFDLAYFTTQAEYMLKRLQNLDLSAPLVQSRLKYLQKRHIPFNNLTEKKLALCMAKSLLSIKTLTTHAEGAQILVEIESNVKKAI